MMNGYSLAKVQFIIIQGLLIGGYAGFYINKKSYFWVFSAVSYMFWRNALLYNMLAYVWESVLIHFREWLGPNHSVVLHALSSD